MWPVGCKLLVNLSPKLATHCRAGQTCGSGTPWKRDTLEKRVHSSSGVALTLADAQATCARGESVSIITVCPLHSVGELTVF